VNSADELSVELPPTATSPQAPINPPALTEITSQAQQTITSASPNDPPVEASPAKGDTRALASASPSENVATTNDGTAAAAPKDREAAPKDGAVEPKESEAAPDVAAADDPPIQGERVDLWREWPIPEVALVVTGQQNGYIEPCGCTGLDRQKGGLARRYTLMKQLREKGWSLLPLDAGNQVRRFGRQAEVQLQQSVKALTAMDYRAVGFGPDDLRLGVGELLAVASGDSPDDTMFVSSNVVLIDESLVPKVKIVDVNGLKFGITSVLDPAELEGQPSDDIKVTPKEAAAMSGLQALQVAEAGFKILMFYGREEVAKKLVQEIPGFHLVIVAGGYGEPTYQPESIEGSKTQMIVTGNKGMYAGLVGIYRDGPLRYARVPLTHEFEDAPEMREVMHAYQQQLQDIGLQGLGLLPPIPHGSGQQFVGTQKCGECHTDAYDIWKGTPHALATDHIVQPPKERGDIARHFDPECLSCHVTGWNPQEYYPYLSGYLSLPESNHLTGNGCENCHGPGSEHSAAEAEGSTVAEETRDQLREAMKLPLDKARDKCMTCHDLDNSPDFHEDNAFEDVYWPEVEH
jgi:hypothetical protein